MTSLDLSMEGYRAGPEAIALQETVLARVRALPAVQSAALALDLPLDMSRNGSDIFPEGWVSEDGRGINVDFDVVSEGYFETLGVPLLQGRTFQPSDRTGSERVAVVGRTLAERVWPGEAALGRRFRFSEDEDPVTVVGVVEDVKSGLLTDEPTPMAYVPTAQRYQAATWLVFRGRGPGDSGDLGPAVRAAILEVDGSLSLTPVVSLERYTSLGILPQRLAAAVTTSLGLLALLLTAVGLYGMVAQAALQRTREIGIRMALGARRGRVVARVLAGGVGLAAPGLLLGGALALGVGPLLGRFLLGLGPLDPVALAGVALLLLATVVTASVIPALRAARVDPAEALRSE
jgi:predicted permease